MPESSTRSRTAAGAIEPLSPVRENRIDPPHPMANGREIAANSVENDAGLELDGADVEVASLAMVQQLRLQAQQLSQHLAQQQTDLDRREAELQARGAQLDQQERNNRLWLKERHAELADREAALMGREQALAEGASQLEQLEKNVAERRRDGERELETRREAIERRETGLREAEEQIAVRAKEIETAADALKDAGAVHEELVADLERRTGEFDARRSVILEMIARFLSGEAVLAARPRHGSAKGTMPDEFDAMADLLDKLQSRRKHLADAEELLARAESEVAELRQSLLADRQQLDAERQDERRRNAELRRRAADDLARRQETLEAASQQLELRRAAVEQMRAELTIAQREALENRLAAEELVGQLAGAIPPAQLSHQIARSRARLSECYRLQQEGIVEERRRLEELAAQIAEQHGRLAAQKRDLERWLRQRTDEAEAETARLAARENRLDRQRDLVEKQRFDWEHERQEYQHQIRRLLAELGR